MKNISCHYFVLIIYFGYNNYRENECLKHDKLELTNKIEQLQQTIARNNQIIADNEQLKREFIETCNQDKKAIGLIKIIDFYIV